MLVDRLVGYNRLHAGFAEINLFRNHTAVSGRTDSNGRESNIFLDFQRAFIKRGSSGRFRAVQGVMDRRIVNGRQSDVQCTVRRVRRVFGSYIKYMFGIVVSFRIVPFNQARQTGQEVFIILLVGSRPLDFGQGSPTGQYHILGMRESRNVFSPEVSLHAFDIFLFFRSEGSRHRLVAVHSFKRQVTTNTGRFVLRIFCLVVVEIQVSVRSHDNIVFLLGCFDTALFTTP